MLISLAEKKSLNLIMEFQKYQPIKIENYL